MTAIFISHSTADNAEVAALVEELEQHGFSSLFVDYDPEKGIPSGQNWEQSLYQQLRSAQAVIVLCSPDGMSSEWVFAEIIYARAQGKPLIPLLIVPCVLRSILQDIQVLDFTDDREVGLKRLWRSLHEAGVDPTDPLQWQGTRPPYPGLTSFSEEDAAVFFGREEEIRSGLDTLNQMRFFGGARVCLFLGPSGSGKSSLVRAGIVPRLERSAQWRIIGSFRPGTRPLAAFGDVLARATRCADASPQPSTATATLQQGSVDPLLKLLDEAGGSRGTSCTAIVIDQLEELLSTDSSRQEEVLLSLLAQATKDPQRNLLVVATMRSDFLDAYQKHPILSGMDFRTIWVRPLGPKKFGQVIAAPAWVAGIELQAGLEERMSADTAGQDALPLLAFALRELWERFNRNGHITIENYEVDLGGLKGAIQRAADGVLAAAKCDRTALHSLRQAFRHMVRIVEAEHGESEKYARRVAYWDELPQESHDILRRFVDARLLVSGKAENALEVAHEELFRAWPTLATWLKQDRAFLLWRRRLDPALEEWSRSRTPLRDAPLAEAEHWLQLSADDLTEPEREFVCESIALRDRALAKRRRLRRAVFVGLSIGLLAVSALGGVSVWQWDLARRNAAEARAQLAENFWIEGVRSRDDQDDPVRAGHNFARAARLPDDTWLSRSAVAALRFVNGRIRLERVLQTDNSLVGVAFSPDLGRVLAWGEGAEATLWRPESDRPAVLAHAGIKGASFRTNDRFVTWGGTGGVRLWEGPDPAMMGQLGHAGAVLGARMSPDASFIASWDDRDTVYVWEADQGQLVHRFGQPGGVGNVDFSPDSRRLLVRGKGTLIQVLNLGLSGQPERLEHTTELIGSGFNHDGQLVLSLDNDSTVRIWARGETTPRVLRHRLRSAPPLDGVVFFGRNDGVAQWDSRGNVQLWNLQTNWSSQTMAHGAPLHCLEFGPQEAFVVTCGELGKVRIWDPSGRPLRTLSHGSAVRGVTIDAGGARLLTWSTDGSARLWDAQTGELIGLPMRHASGVAHASFGTDEQRIATWSKQESARIWSAPALGTTFATLPDGARILDLAFEPGRETLIALGDNGQIHRWRRGQKSSLSSELLPGVRSSDSIEYGQIVAAANRLLGRDGTSIRVWNTDDGDLRSTIQIDPERPELEGSLLTMDGTLILTWGADGYARAWDADNARPVVALAHGAHILSLAANADNSRIVTTGAEFVVKAWGLPQGDLLSTLRFDSGLRHVSIDPDGRRGAAALANGTIRVWNLDSGEIIAAVRHGRAPKETRYSPDGTSLASWDGSGLIRLWDAVTLDELATPMNHHPGDALARLRGVTFDSKGHWILSWDDGGGVRLWDRRTGNAVSPRLSHAGHITKATLTTEPSVAIAWGDRSVRIWPLPTRLQGSSIGLVAEQELISGTTLGERGEIRVLSSQEWRALRNVKPIVGSD